jgi:hypothetical protein
MREKLSRGIYKFLREYVPARMKEKTENGQKLRNLLRAIARRRLWQTQCA